MVDSPSVPGLFGLFDQGKFNVGGGSSIDETAVSSLSDLQPEQDFLVQQATSLALVDLNVDYSDFTNFVRLNSAQEYFSITADKILGQYPLNDSVAQKKLFTDSLDGYQRYVLNQWPSTTGYLNFDRAISASYITVDDYGVIDGISRSSILSPGTGSLTVQCWYNVSALTGTQDVQFIFQKQSSAGDGISLFCSGSNIIFSVISGTSAQSVSAPISTGTNFVSAIMARDSMTGSLCIFTGSLSSFPIAVSSASINFVGRFDLGPLQASIGSGTLVGKTTLAFSGSLDDLSVWSLPLTSAQLTSSYNRKIYAQPGLLAAWRFNESQNFPSTVSASRIVQDCSGHKLNGTIRQYYPSLRASGTLSNDSPDPILSFDDPNVVDFIVSSQTSGSAYDAQNLFTITNLFPEAFTSDVGDSAGIFKSFLYVVGRYFDSIYLYIKQFNNLRTVNYDDFDQAPDAVLGEVGTFFGWDLVGSFVDQDLLRFFLGRNVGTGPDANVELDSKLYEIKNQFWRRTLQNLMYVYKTRGTRESIEALLKVYGVSSDFIRLKEHGSRRTNGFQTRRHASQKSIEVLRLDSTSFSGRVSSSAPFVLGSNSGQFSLEVRSRFPVPSDSSLLPSKLSGTLARVISGSDAGNSVLLSYRRDSLLSTTGSLYASSSLGSLQLGPGPFFDGRWFNLSLVREQATGSLSLSAQADEDGTATFNSSSVVYFASTDVGQHNTFTQASIGNVLGGAGSSEGWLQEFRLWDDVLEAGELSDHSLNFQSYGRRKAVQNNSLALHWRLDDAPVCDISGNFLTLDSSIYHRDGNGTGFVPSSQPFDKFLLDYAYILPFDSDIDDDDISVYGGVEVPVDDLSSERRSLSLELNMVDALNEDISRSMSSISELNNLVGLPINKYRTEYEGLRGLRETYFRRLQGDLNFEIFATMLDFFDRTFINLVQRLVPARADFIGDEFVVESHMLERSKYQYNIRPVEDGAFDIGGEIRMTEGDGR